MPAKQPDSPLERFTGLAVDYSRWRPSYPAAVLDFLARRCSLTAGAVVVDIGCGTGIATRLFAARGCRVLGIEPNADMRTQAETEPCTADIPPIYRSGRAEATGLPNALADVVVAAQAFHWFDAPAALQEMYRILRPGGWAVLIWNERNPADPFTAAYGAAFAALPTTAAIEGQRSQAGQALLTSDLFEEQEVHIFDNQQTLDEQGVLGRAFSTSYAPRDPQGTAALKAALRTAFHQHQRDGKVVLHYRTSVYLGRRPLLVAEEGS